MSSRAFLQVGTMTDPSGRNEFVTVINMDGEKMIVTQMEPSYAQALGKQLIDAANALVLKRSDRQVQS